MQSRGPAIRWAVSPIDARVKAGAKKECGKFPRSLFYVNDIPSACENL